MKNFRDMGEDLAFSLLGRHVAPPRIYLMLDVVERFARKCVPTRRSPCRKDSEGFGLAPRGSLMHFTKVATARSTTIIVSATLWNCAPNDTGMRGALEEALIGVPRH